MNDLIYAPWDEKQVESLNAYQACDKMHPYTASDGDILRATRYGWVHPVFGEVVQTWALWAHTDGSWRDVLLAY